MDIKKFADYLIREENNNGVPVFLYIDETNLCFDLKRIAHILVSGNDSTNQINEIISKIHNCEITIINTLEDLQLLFTDYQTAMKNHIRIFPSIIAVIYDLSKFNGKEEVDKIKEILCHGNPCGINFICAYKQNIIKDEISWIFPMRVDNFYSDPSNKTNALLNFVGTVTPIKFGK